MQSQQSATIVPERWQKWAGKCRDQAPASRKWWTSVLGLFEESSTRWIEDNVADATRAMRVSVRDDDMARAKVLEALNSAQFTTEDRRAMVSAWLCRDLNGAADAESNPQIPIAVRLLIKTGREEQW
jgi:hypothetical protein